MKRIIGVILIAFLTIYCTFAFAQYNNSIAENTSSSPGMEVIEAKGVNIMVPKGTRIRREGGLLIIEDISAYSARKFVELEGRLNNLEIQQNELKVHIDRVIKLVEELQKRLLVLFNSKFPAQQKKSEPEQAK